MSRALLFKIHFYLSGFLAPFILLMALTGTLYLFGHKGETVESLVNEGISFNSSESKTEQISNIIKEHDSSYKFETLKDRGSSIQTRPTTRTFYNFKKEENGSYTLYKVSPDIHYRIIEVHKGHGPSLLKYFQKLLGISLMIIVLSGFWMSLKIKKRKKEFLLLSGAGFIFLLSLFLL